ncbi:hypothetical protein KL918_005135 [Ogataea parapolymorpha]|uniref:Protein BOI2 n=1 Tax=Ogataea parapolymorpha (strain ATCC 26012 / BCRC 20466 / JCM 22074 / NRRL Y-7560 / DL-1) TaxID=871575 RepID=W1QBM2_OGAPD|nr:Protein BOI2 [Ogataea parapolymorpha DL-1]ESW98412.1 Protein BOI2 [Ogataea parapolymorpha DL-1]KAG7864814.1 hypothetical protein KL918_005135 [Ogataea parapolymorpha]KAG7873318.1 hypothetical protein KL916_002267 [Ogataea parapolymorpha]
MSTGEGYENYYSVIKEFNARLGDELTIRPGDTIELISDDSEFGDGWYMGRNLTTNRVGLYPKAFTKSANGQSKGKPSLLRSRSRRTPLNSPVAATPSSGISDYSSLSQHQKIEESISPSVTADRHNNMEGIVTRNTEETPYSQVHDTNFNRYISVHRTLSDIDKALQELHSNEYPSTTENHSILLDPAEVASWTPEQVTQYFSGLNFDIESAGQFARHKISGAILLQLELPYLKELEITSFGTRFEIYKEIEELRLASKNKTHGRRIVSPNTRLGNPEVKVAPRTHARKRSQSMDDILRTSIGGSKSSVGNSLDFKQSSRDTLEVDSKLQSYIETPSDNDSEPEQEFSTPTGLFESPRKAPQPPSHASPLIKQNSQLLFENDGDDGSNRRYQHSRGSSIGNTSSIYTEKKHSRNPSSTSFTNALQQKGALFTKTHSRTNSDFSVAQKDASWRYVDKNFEPHVTQKQQSKGDNGRSLPSANKSLQTLETGVKPEKLDFDRKNSNRRSISAKDMSPSPKTIDPKRIASAAAASASNNSKTSGLRSFGGLRSSKISTSAFQEGIRNISPDEAIRTADYSGWMSKRGNLSIGSWKQRYFTLHKTRLSYFGSLKDRREKGLIDITAHRVLPAVDTEDKLSTVYAATTGSGRYCFKLVPPAPGSKKGLTFTQQKVHYFAVETKDEMRGWMAALMKATIELDESVPAISSCVTPTIPLQKAQERMVEARENARLNLEKLEKGECIQDTTTDEDMSLKSNNISATHTPITQPSTQFQRVSTTPTSTNSSNRRPSVKVDTTTGLPESGALTGLSTPYLVTSGIMSPNSSSTSDLNSPGSASLRATKNTGRKIPTASTNPVPMITKLDTPQDQISSSSNTV